MNLLQTWAQQLMVGTARKQPTIPSIPGSVGTLLSELQVCDTSLEITALRIAGVLQVCHAASITGASPSGAYIAPSPIDNQEAISVGSAIVFFETILKEAPTQLQAQALTLLIQLKLCLAPALLVPALESGRKNASLQALVLSTLGCRGRWLASLNPRWAYANKAHVEHANPQFSPWDEGDLATRKAYLLSLRALDPSAGLSLLIGRWKEINVRERTQLLELIEADLHPGDQDFLEELLLERSKEIRNTAIELLCKLAPSRYLARMKDRLRQCLTHERSFFKTTVRLGAPSVWDDSYKKDGLEPTPPDSLRMGERAYWLFQITRTLPLNVWPELTGLTPAQLIKWSKTSDWTRVLHLAWRDAWARETDPAWALALLSNTPSEDHHWEPFELVAALNPIDRELHWIKMLTERSDGTRLGYALSRIVTHLDQRVSGQYVSRFPNQVSATFAQQVIKLVKHELGNFPEKIDHMLKDALSIFICLMPEECLESALGDWPTSERSLLSETIAQALAVAKQRKQLLRYLNRTDPL